MRPYFFVYSTFLQRGYDQVLHDVCIQKLPVTLMLDRAGISNEDGQSHQGLYDFAYLRHIPNMTVLAPADGQELEMMIDSLQDWNAPCSIRYPKNAEKLPEDYQISNFQVGRWQDLRPGTDGVILSVGTMTSAALRIADALYKNGLDLRVVNASTIKPLDQNCLDDLFQESLPIFTLEEHVLQGGFGSAVLEYAALHGVQVDIRPMGVPDRFIQHGDHQHLLKDVGLDDDTIIQMIQTHLQEREHQ